MTPEERAAAQTLADRLREAWSKVPQEQRELFAARLEAAIGTTRQIEDAERPS
jgi:hypothetical protein